LQSQERNSGSLLKSKTLTRINEAQEEIFDDDSELEEELI